MAALQNASGLVVVGFAPTLEAARPRIKAPDFEVLLLDASRDYTGAVAVVHEIKDSVPALKLLILGSESTDENVLGFIECGANGYLSKHSSLGQLVDAIEAAYREEMLYSPQLIGLAVSRLRELSRERDQPALLSLREKEILQLVSHGLGNKEIASQLGISTATAKNHVHNILRKLKVTRRREAIRKALLANILTQSRSSLDASDAHSRQTLAAGNGHSVNGSYRKT
jgi:DNA-binding NarL/FixJ family response regulator